VLTLGLIFWCREIERGERPIEKSGAEIQGHNAALELDFWVFHLGTNHIRFLSFSNLSIEKSYGGYTA